MKSRKIGGLVAVIVGIVIILLALYAKSRVSTVKENIRKESGFFSNNPVDKGINGALEEKIGEYDAPILWSFIGGFVLVLGGTAFLVYRRRRR